MHDNLYASTEGDSTVRMLSANLDEATDAFAASSLAKDVFGEKMHAAWVEYKRAEWLSYVKHVSDWEVDRYLRQFG